MRHAAMVLVLGVGTLAAGCQGSGEYIPPLKPLGEGVPADLPALGSDDFTIVRLVING